MDRNVYLIWKDLNKYEFEISDKDSANRDVVFFDFLIKLHSQDLESVFIGDYAGGLKNYNGVYLPCGMGVCRFKNGDFYEGFFKKGKQHGTGRMIYGRSLKVKEGKFKCGECVSELVLEEQKSETKETLSKSNYKVDDDLSKSQGDEINNNNETNVLRKQDCRKFHEEYYKSNTIEGRCKDPKVIRFIIKLSENIKIWWQKHLLLKHVKANFPSSNRWSIEETIKYAQAIVKKEKRENKNNNNNYINSQTPIDSQENVDSNIQENKNEVSQDDLNFETPLENLQQANIDDKRSSRQKFNDMIQRFQNEDS